MLISTDFSLLTDTTNSTRLSSLGRLAILAIAGMCFSLAPRLCAQTAFPVPPATGSLGNKDASALTELKAFVAATSGASWQDIEASGTLTFPAGDEHSVQLYASGADSARLDISMSEGTRSLRINSASGQFLDERGGNHKLSPGTARAGIIAFPRIWTFLAGAMPMSIRDQGSVSVAGQNLHRVTFEYPLAKSSGSETIPTVATDLYFDPSSHLLVLSIDALRLQESPTKLFIRTTQYGNYQRISGVMVPMTIQQALDDQPLWGLQLTQVTVNSNLSSDTFTF